MSQRCLLTWNINENQYPGQNSKIGIIAFFLYYFITYLYVVKMNTYSLVAVASKVHLTLKLNVLNFDNFFSCSRNYQKYL